MISEPSMTVRPMTRNELDLCIQWSAEQGWNPGLDDADAFWAADPEGYVVAVCDGQIIGTGAIVAYGRQAGAMGLFIMREDRRGEGLGSQLWHKRKQLLQARLEPGACIWMDGVVAMQPFYSKGGFEFTHTDARYQGTFVEPLKVEGDTPVDLSTVPFEQVMDFDQAHFGASRASFLKLWIRPKQGAALAIVEKGEIAAMGVVRRCLVGYKIGPLFSRTPEHARNLFRELANRAEGEPVSLDVPAVNAAAVALASQHQMVEVFQCGRMVLGSPPALPWNQIYGVTTLELG